MRRNLGQSRAISGNLGQSRAMTIDSCDASSYVTVASRRSSPPFLWLMVQISKPSYSRASSGPLGGSSCRARWRSRRRSFVPLTMREWRLPSRVERAVMQPTCGSPGRDESLGRALAPPLRLLSTTTPWSPSRLSLPSLQSPSPVPPSALSLCSPPLPSPSALSLCPLPASPPLRAPAQRRTSHGCCRRGK